MFFVAFTLLVASLCFTTASSSSPKVTAAGYQYGIQMDAGSSGTRLYVYKWNERIFHQLPPSLTQVMTEESWSKKQKPGISTFAKNPSGAGASIQPLLDFAINTVLKSEGVTDLSGVRKSTPHILIILFLSAATLPLATLPSAAPLLSLFNLLLLLPLIFCFTVLLRPLRSIIIVTICRQLSFWEQQLV